MSQNFTTWDRTFAVTQKEGVLRIFIAIKIPSPLAGIKPANLLFNGKHANH
jgi:hypothetical protein